MNIFFLSKDPVKSAKVQYNKHVVKMILESAQMLCTAHHHYDGNSNEIPYKKAHYNHPCTIWCRENQHQYKWLYDHMIALGSEYNRRYGKTHKTITRCKEFLANYPEGMPIGVFNDPPQCMPDEYKVENDCVASYWNYYEKEKYLIRNKDESIITRNL